MITELDKKQQEQLKRVEEIEEEMARMQEKLHFLSVLESKN